MSNQVPEFDNLKTELRGFPWLTASVLYTLSWGWSLLRPNTLYWDDWAYIFNRPKSYLNEIFVDTGLPPWRAIIDQELIAIGYWTIPVLTFLMYFASSVVIFLLAKQTSKFSTPDLNILCIVFALAPVAYSRISLQMFGYTTSQFLFFLAWLILIKHKNKFVFFVSFTLFYWSFMTHSFLFFFVLPVLHFFILNFVNLNEGKPSGTDITKLIFLLSAPVTYLTLRSFFWPPTEEYISYHRITKDGVLLGGIVMGVGFLLSAGLLVIAREQKKSQFYLAIGPTIFSWALFPYFANKNLIDPKSIFAFRSDYGSRHLLLTPLGIALSVVALRELLSNSCRKFLSFSLVAIFVLVNFFSGWQFFIDSHKKEQLIELFRETPAIGASSKVIFVDKTKHLNGKFSSYRNSELNSLIFLSGKNVQEISGKSSCSDFPDAIILELNSSREFFDLITGSDLGLYFRVTSC